ncbi:MAG: sugar kinase [Roseiflexaceae bacterium]|nr:sugar kinase [Roseiflexaceae bacterium]
MPNSPLDLLAIGETLIDFISTEPAESLSEAEQFRRHLGGSPANIAVTVARLGGRAAVASRVGAGALGRFVRRELEQRGVITDYLCHDPDYRTTIILVTKTEGTPDFEVFHGADAQLQPDDVPEEALARATVVHTSTFALARNPCRQTVIGAMRRAAALGKVVSLDPNYSPKLWPDIEEARAVLTELYAHVTITKPSLDDAARLFGGDMTPEQSVRRFHELGPRTVVLTMGKRGTLLSHAGQLTHIPARLVDVVDATGAGDAFYGGFLTAYTDGLTLVQCVHVANAVVAQKLQRVGQLTEPLNKQAIYAMVGI